MSVHDKEAEAKAKALFGISEDEPIFVLRAQDRLYTPMLAVYEQLYLSTVRASKPVTDSYLGDLEAEFADNVSDSYEAGRNWQKANADRVKIPD